MNDNGTNSSVSSRSGSVGESENRIHPVAIINSINYNDDDSLISGSICSFNYSGRASLQLPHFSGSSNIIM